MSHNEKSVLCCRLTVAESVPIPFSAALQNHTWFFQNVCNERTDLRKPSTLAVHGDGILLPVQTSLSHPEMRLEVTLPEAELSLQKPARHSALSASGQPKRSAAEDANVNENARCGQRYICSANVNDAVQPQDRDYAGLRGLCTIWLCGYSPANRPVD